MSYIVVGKVFGRKVYWNKESKGWYMVIERATLFPNMESALGGQYYAESVLVPEMVTDIDVEKLGE